MRARTGFAVVAALAIAGGCNKKSDKTDDKTGATAVEHGGGNGGDPGKDTQAALALIPDTSELVVGFNFSELRKSPMWAEVEPAMMAQAGPDLAKFKDRCGFDPIASVSSFALGMKNLGQGLVPEMVLVVHGPDKGKMLDCIAKSKDELAAKGTQVTVDGDTVTFKDTKSADAPPGVLTFADDTTAVIQFAPTATKDTIKALLKSDKTLKNSKQFGEMIAKVNTSASLWGVANGASHMFDAVPPTFGRPAAVFGSLDVAAGLSVDLRVRMESADKATQLANLGNTQVTGAKAYVTKLEIKPEGNDVHLVVEMTEAQLKSLSEEMKGLASAWMGSRMAAEGTPPPTVTVPAATGSAGSGSSAEAPGSAAAPAGSGSATP